MNPILYILMRTDLNSMNPGKAVAHGAHAANQFTFMMEHDNIFHDYGDLYKKWINSAHGFGTTICLSVNGETLQERIDSLREIDCCCAIVNDPTYPINDGEYTHIVSLDTCGFVFGDKYKLGQYISDLELMP